MDPDITPWPCRNEVVYLAVRRRKFKHEDTDRIKPDAFYLREIDGQFESGISVIVAEHCPTIDEARELLGMNTLYGIDSLSTEAIRNLGLDVMQDSATHAEIVGLPPRTGHDLENDVRADLLANSLAQICEIRHR
jgi:hypothetical protein